MYNKSKLTNTKITKATGQITHVPGFSSTRPLNSKLQPTRGDHSVNGFMPSRPTTGGLSRGPRPR